MRLLRLLEPKEDLLFDQADAAAHVGAGTGLLERSKQIA